ncbi:Cysteine synthase A [Phytophthora cinnamomi]|uniref:Cysteine synthase A n=1 Tax=Phytophthora cinnamomi TaxID=4785 RepID=UPI0035596511|nr:Cysteine synthase A [Phytophthora cinnamomi]
MHGIPGIGPGFVPDILGRELIDDVFTLSTEDAFTTAKRLALEEGILVGSSSRASEYATLQIAKRPENAGKLIVGILPSFGERYLSSTLFDEFAASLPLPSCPTLAVQFVA